MNLATIGYYYDVIDARIAAGRLEAVGIPAHLQYINHLSVDWLVGAALGGIPLQVPVSLADEAREILAENVALKPDEDRCPECGSPDTTRQLLRWRISMLVFHAVFPIPLPWGAERRKCQACGCGWEPCDDG